MPWVIATFACGGGGGGSSGGGPGRIVEPLVYTGNSDPAIITTSNAPQLILLVIGSDDTLSLLADGSDDRGESSAGRSRGLVDLARRLRGTLSRDAIAACLPEDARRVRALSIPIDGTEPCGSGYVHTFGTLADDGTGTLTVDYLQCTMGDQTLDGRASLRIDEFDFSHFVPIRFTESFPRLALQSGDSPGAIGGSLQYEEDLPSNTETVTIDLVTLDSTSDQMTKAEGLVLVDTYYDAYYPSSYRETADGRLFDSIEGYVDVASLEPLGFKAGDQPFPNPGTLLLTGAAGATIRATVVSSTLVMPELDLDGDGTEELGTTIPWGALTSGAPIDYERPTAPDLTATVNGDGSVALVWTPSSDASGIAEYRILRSGALLGRVSDTSFTDRGAEPGRVHDYRVRAVDGAGNLSPRIAAQSVTIPSGGSGIFDPPITGDLTDFPDSTKIGLAVEDVDGDGSPDLFATGVGALDVNTARGPLAAGLSFSSSSVYFSTLSNEANLPCFSLQNLLGDGAPEAFAIGRAVTWDATASAWKQVDGSGAPPGYDPRAFADVNDDGVIDAISVLSGFTTTISSVLAFPDASFDESSARDLGGLGSFAWSRVGSIAAADFDRDGLTDLLIWDSDVLRVARQAKRGTFELTAALPAISDLYFRSALHVGDVTGDGYPDVVFANYAGSANELRVHVNDGSGGFSGTSIASGIDDPWNFRSADLDGDGREDLVVLKAQGSSIDSYRSKGDGTFTLIYSIAQSGYPQLELADVDRDGDVDLLTAGANASKTVSLYLNQ